MKTGIQYDFKEENIQGKAELTESQLRSLSNQQSVRLRKDLIYVVAPQFVHNEKLSTPINGNDTSKRIFVVGFNPEINEPVQVVTLSINGLTQRHYGAVAGNEDLRIPATMENDAKAWRAVSGIPMEGVFSVGTAPIKIAGKNAYTTGFAFKVVDRKRCFVAQFAAPRKADGHDVYDMLTFEEEGKHYLQLGFSNLNDYAIVDKVPAINWKEVCPQVAAFQDGIPA